MTTHEFAVCRSTRIETPQPPKRTTISAMRGPRWARRALNHVLEWLKATTDQEPTISHVRRFVAPDGSFLERRNLQQRDMQRIYDRRARTLLVGPDAWGDVRDTLRDTASVMSFETEMRIGNSGRIEIRGVEVVLVPWMTGVLLVPDWKEVRP